MKVIRRIRICLKCRKEFFSLSPANRICVACHRDNRKRFGDYPETLLATERGRKYHNGEVLV